MPIDSARTARGALAGTAAAGVWAAQAPLDKRVFRFDYDDPEILGKAVTRGRAWPVIGLALHLANGALFGAVYASAAPRMPVPPWARGPLAGLAEHLATWPLASVSAGIHPAREELPRVAGNARAFAQATWRHLLFGVVLGELERRLNPPPEPEPEPYSDAMSSNGHGDLDHAIGVARP